MIQLYMLRSDWLLLTRMFYIFKHLCSESALRQAFETHCLFTHVLLEDGGLIYYFNTSIMSRF